MTPKHLLSQSQLLTKTSEVSNRLTSNRLFSFAKGFSFQKRQKDFRSLFLRPLLSVLILSLFLASCAPPAPPDSTEGDSGNEASETGNGQTIYMPLSNSNPSSDDLPSEPPLTEWTSAGGVIPIMPGAIAGQTADGRYAFITSAAVPDIETYYLQELANRGWESLSIGESEGVKDLLFQTGDTRLTIHIEILATQDLTYVVIEG